MNEPTENKTVAEELELTAEDFIVPRNMTTSLTSEIEKKDDENGEPEDQAYISRLRTLAGMNKI